MITDKQLQTILAFGSEQRGVEFKRSGSLQNAAYRARVIRAILGMANRRDGGLVILGVDDDDPLGSAGVDASIVAEWTVYDDVADQVARYADPGIEFLLAVVIRESSSFVVVEVHEFQDHPVICKMPCQSENGQVILRRGAIYIRPTTGKIETREIANSVEMRELLDLAREKRLR